MVCISFWFKFFGISFKIEYFIFILGKCFDFSWITRVLFEVFGENNKGFIIGRATVVVAVIAGFGKVGEGEKEKVLVEFEKVVIELSVVILLDKKEGE